MPYTSFCQRYTRLERKYSEGLENCLATRVNIETKSCEARDQHWTSSVLYTAMAYLLVVSLQQAKTSPIIGVHTLHMEATHATVHVCLHYNFVAWSAGSFLKSVKSRIHPNRECFIANKYLRKGIIESRMFSRKQCLRSRFANFFFRGWFPIYGIIT